VKEGSATIATVPTAILTTNAREGEKHHPPLSK